MGCCTCVQANQSVKIRSCTGREIKHGPGCIMYCCWSNTEVIEKIILTAEQYLKVTYMAQQDHGDIIEHVPGPCIYQQNDGYAIVEGPLRKTELNNAEYVVCTDPKTGFKSVIEGPIMYMPKPYELVSAIQRKISLLNNQFVNVTDLATGHIKIVSGPTIFTPGAFESVGAVLNKVEMSQTQFIICTDGQTGEKREVEGPMLYVPKVYEEVSAVREKINLKNNQYCHIKDLQTGEVTLEQGPKVFLLNPFQQASQIYDCLSLNFAQYVIIQHSLSGLIRIEKGPARVMILPFENIIKDEEQEIRNALTADANNAIHIRDIISGTEKLITEPQLYFPDSPNIKILGVRPLIKLASFERMVIMDRDSNLIFKSGEHEPGFFLPPFCTIMNQFWTTGLDKPKKEIRVFDCRFHDMDFKFSARTNDNVEIAMMVNIYWTITDFEKMIKSTNDPPDDICNQIRSQILNISSKMSTKELMEYSSLDLVKQITDEDMDFCASRGIRIVRINITEKKCADPEVDKTYRAVIEQKITRMKNLEAQRGDNDKKIAEIEGKIVFEGENFKLLEKKMQNVQMENETHGKAEGQRLHMFFEGLGPDLSPEAKMKVFLELQRTERIKMVTEKVNTLYVTPTDVDFQLHKIENSSDNDVKLTLNVNKELNYIITMLKSWEEYEALQEKEAQQSTPGDSLVDLTEPPYPNYSELNINKSSGSTGCESYVQKVELIKDQKIPIFPINTQFIELNAQGYNLKVQTIEIRCPDTNLILTKNSITSNHPIIFDYSNLTIRLLTPNFEENRVLLKDGTSIMNGYKVYDFDYKSILVRNNLTTFSIQNDMSEVKAINLLGDFCLLSCEDGLFDGKDLKVKTRGLSKIELGKSTVKSISIDNRMAEVDSSNITSG